VTDAQRVAFDEQGYLSLPGALAGAALAQVQEAAAQAEALWRADTTRQGARSAALDQVQAPIEYDDRLLALLWHPTVFPLVRTLLGDDVMMIDNDLFLTPPHTPHTHAGWHHDVGMQGIYHPKSLLMVKVFYLLSDVDSAMGPTTLVPGSHRGEESPQSLESAVPMTGKAGDAYLFNCRIYHCAANNGSDRWRRVLIYNYGHFWMKVWQGYEPSARLLDAAHASGDPVFKQLLGIGDAYGQRLAA
jgi:Phytanoyl-CoA dioxygenase (PhyH)